MRIFRYSPALPSAQPVTIGDARDARILLVQAGTRLALARMDWEERGPEQLFDNPAGARDTSRPEYP